MTKRDLSRFERIEKERGEPVKADRGDPAPGRFDAPPQPSPVAATPVAPAPQRFEPEGLQMAQGPQAALAMIRCPRCQTDNGKFERTCLGCRGPLDDAETRAFNELLLDLWQEAQAQEREVQAVQRDEQLAELAEAKAVERARYEAMARQVAERVKRTLPADTLDERLRRWADAGRDWLARRLEKKD